MFYSIQVFNETDSEEKVLLALTSATPFSTFFVGNYFIGPDLKHQYHSSLKSGEKYEITRVEHHILESDALEPKSDSEVERELEHSLRIFVKVVKARARQSPLLM